MNWLTAIRLVLTSPYVLRRRHKWLPASIDRTGLWPHVTLGWWTWDTLGEAHGMRLTELVDTMRARPGAPKDGQP